MKNIAIMTDSNSGITQKQAGEMGIYVIPMPFDIDDGEYFEDINLTQEEFYDKLVNGAEISTSQPSVETLINEWNTLLKSYDQVVHIPMSSGLSGSCDTARAMAEDFKGRVIVVDNQHISVTQRQSALDARKLAEEGKTGEEIRDILERTKMDSMIYITVDTLEYLKKGGRLTPAVAAIGSILKIKPVLKIKGEKLDKFSMARTMKHAKGIMTEAIQKDIRQMDPEGLGANMHIAIAHTKNYEAACVFRDELLKIYPGHDIYIDKPSLSVACHIGPGALAVTCMKKL